MDNVKLILVLIVLIMEVACSKKSEQPVKERVNCSPYPSAYEVEFPDNSIRKATIEACGSSFKATDLGQGSATIISENIVVQLKDKDTGLPYLTTFDGQ